MLSLEASGGASGFQTPTIDDLGTDHRTRVLLTDERYLTMTLLIRSRLDNKGNKPPPEAYAFNTSRLISKLDSVEVRAICRFGLTGDWEEVLNEAGGSMIDTLALALKWAEDGSVSLISVAPSSLPCSRPKTDSVFLPSRSGRTCARSEVRRWRRAI